jgi:hypothetical protein
MDRGLHHSVLILPVIYQILVVHFAELACTIQKLIQGKKEVQQSVEIKNKQNFHLFFIDDREK